jgi:hypothetical protein
MNKTELLQWLKTNEVEVIFTKVDGTERIMKCTLKSEFLPESLATHHKTPSDQVVNVFDLDKQSWRSFRLDSIKSVKVL